MDAHTWIELWKAIHGGCWPGPPPDNRLSELTRDVIAGLALHNLSHAFGEAAVAKQVRSVAVESLQKSLPALQQGLRG
jgi:hypothetical protein